MPLFVSHGEVKFGVGDRIRVVQKLIEVDKSRQAIFEGIVISIKAGQNPSFVVRRIGEQGVGIERIFPLLLPSIEKIQVIKKGTTGVAHAKLYYLRTKSPKEIEKIYSRASRKDRPVLKSKDVKNKTAKTRAKN